MKRVALLGVLLFVVLLAAGAAGGLYYLRSAAPEHDGTARLAGLAAPVDIWRDSLGVPHVWAASEPDLLFAQGYAHAQDRLWQMELLRRAGEGRLSEILGASVLDTDRFLRALGMARAARAEAAAAPPEILARLDAYVAGVNAYLDSRRGALPPEFLVLRARPERWTRVHSLVIGQMMAFDLSLYGTAVEMIRAAARLDSAQAALLVPFYPEWGATILERQAPPLPAVAALLLDGASMTRASNAWVIGGARTRSGKPILANDMHLALRAPSLWYLMALHADSVDVAGMTIPGVPYVVAGHNRALAWGYTNAMLDDADLFQERVDPADSTRYLVPGGSEPFELLVDTIRVKGQARPEIFRYRRTRHGPVLSDVDRTLGGTPLALRWASHDPAHSLDALRAFNRAHDWASFRAAVAAFDNPHQNVVYADTAGHFGYAMAGRIPVRGDGTRLPPTLPVPGWSGEWDWRGYYPDALHPSVLDPEQGYVVTANNRQAAGADADRISTEWETPFRAERIRAMVRAGSALTAEDVHRMQLDVQDAHAARYRELAAATAARAGAEPAAAALRAWDLVASAESEPAALYYVWYNRLRPHAARALYGDSAGYMPRRMIDVLLERRAVPWREGAAAAAAFDSLAGAAMKDALAVARERTWGELHSVRAEHALGDVALLRRLLGLNVGDVPARGSETTVNVLHHRGTSFPVTGIYGASQRHVVDMADVDGSGGFILPTGQSGLPFARDYRSQFERWRSGGLWRIPLAQSAAAARAVHRLRLEPN